MGFRQDEPQRQASQPKTGCRPQRHKCQPNSNEQATREAALVLDEMRDTASQQQRQRRHRRKHVAREFRLRKAEKHHRKEGPAAEEQPWRVRPALLLPELYGVTRSEEHTSELQSLAYLVCRLLLEKKKKKIIKIKINKITNNIDKSKIVTSTQQRV